MKVTPFSFRPAGIDGFCFYCHQPMGEDHKPDCVLIKKRVLVRATIEYEVEEPASWSGEDIEFHRNEGSWCASNMLDELAEISDEHNCLCDKVQFKYIMDTSEPFLDEG